MSDTNSGGGDRGGSVAESSNEEFMMKVTACDQSVVGLRDPELHYRIGSDPRGYCLIFNVFDFPDTNYDIRNGSEAEAKGLLEVFEQLHFIAKPFHNPSKKDIESTVEEYSKKEELCGHDCIVVIVLSHGHSGGFVGSDGGYIQFKDIVEKLNNKNCSALINKPKLFFFSCCRGDSRDYGIEHQIQALDDLRESVADTIVISTPMPDGAQPITERVPLASDIMICYSTVDGFVSWRCELTGTWLGHALTQTLIKHSHQKDLLQILTQITNDVNKRPNNSKAKQVIEIILRGFKKTFYFNPGYIVKTMRA